MTSQTIAILCSKCNVGVEGATEPDAQATYTCPSCGHSDTYENVMASVTAFSEELMAEHFNKMMVDTFRNSKVIKVTGQPDAKGLHPFITDMKL